MSVSVFELCVLVKQHHSYVQVCIFIVLITSHFRNI